MRTRTTPPPLIDDYVANGTPLNHTTLLVTETTRSRQPRPPAWVPVAGLVAVVGALVPVGMLPVRHRVQDHLAADIRARLGPGSLAGITVEVRGRDAHVGGRVVDARALAELRAQVAGTPGVRAVHTGGLRVGPSPSGPAFDRGGGALGAPGLPGLSSPRPSVSTTMALTLLPSALVVQFDAGAGGRRIVLSGRISSEPVRRRLVTAAVAAVGTAGVDDRLVVDPAVGPFPPKIQGGLGAALRAATAAGMRRAELSVRNDVVRISGVADDEASRRRFLDAATAIVDDPALLRVTVTTAPTEAPATEAPATEAPATEAPATEAPATEAPSGQLTPPAVDRALGRLVEADPITFVSGSARLTPQGLAVVRRAAQLLRENPSVGVRIEGHTDDRGTPASNQRLSDRRARAVRQTLIALGVAATRLQAVGYGQSRPVADNTDPAGRARNRRIAFAVS